jgi:enoyl-[acyl-carrier protein] reductase II
MICTPICDALHIKYPIFQGGMAHIADGKLAAAVSNAGGLGIISAMNCDSKYLKGQIDMAKSLTDKPFGVNVMLMSPHTDEIAAFLAEEKVPVITTGAGNPSKYMDRWNEAGIQVIPVVPSVAIARLVERAGASAVIAEGGESGGHVGDLTTMVLVPQVADAVKIPVIAAGGIGDGRGVAAAFMLGACGVQLGTRFLLARECGVHQNYKDKVLKATDISTIVTGKRLGHPVRSIRTPFSREYAKAEYSTIADDELENMAVGALRLAAVEGDEKKGCFLAGQVAGMLNKEQTAKEIIEEIFEEAETILNGALKWVR